MQKLSSYRCIVLSLAYHFAYQTNLQDRGEAYANLAKRLEDEIHS